MIRFQAKGHVSTLVWTISLILIMTWCDTIYIWVQQLIYQNNEGFLAMKVSSELTYLQCNRVRKKGWHYTNFSCIEMRPQKEHALKIITIMTSIQH